MGGGLPIVVDNNLIGAVGVGGGNADEQCAWQGLTAALGPQPALAPAGGGRGGAGGAAAAPAGGGAGGGRGGAAQVQAVAVDAADAADAAAHQRRELALAALRRSADGRAAAIASSAHSRSLRVTCVGYGNHIVNSLQFLLRDGRVYSHHSNIFELPLGLGDDGMSPRPSFIFGRMDRTVPFSFLVDSTIAERTPLVLVTEAK